MKAPVESFAVDNGTWCVAGNGTHERLAEALDDRLAPGTPPGWSKPRS